MLESFLKKLLNMNYFILKPILRELMLSKINFIDVEPHITLARQ